MSTLKDFKREIIKTKQDLRLLEIKLKEKDQEHKLAVIKVKELKK